MVIIGLPSSLSGFYFEKLFWRQPTNGFFSNGAMEKYQYHDTFLYAYYRQHLDFFIIESKAYALNHYPGMIIKKPRGFEHFYNAI